MLWAWNVSPLPFGLRWLCCRRSEVLWPSTSTTTFRSVTIVLVHEIDCGSDAMSPISPVAVTGLLETCQQLAAARRQIAAVLADLPEPVAALRKR